MDNAATTMPDESVTETMLPFLRELYANPSAAYGAAARIRKSIGRAREQIAELINAEPDEIYFTSGGTESNNTAIKGAALGKNFGKILTSDIEHPSVINALDSLRGENFDIRHVSPDNCGIVSCEAIEETVTAGTGFVSVMTANNEVGAVNDIAAIGALCRERGILFHTDAVQAVGHIPVDVKSMNIDMLSASGHKFHGPKGIGFLYVRRGVDIPPLVYGGGQERGLRSGTENVAAIAGMGAAAEKAMQDMETDTKRIASLRDRLIGRVLNEIPDSILNGPSDTNKRLPGNAHFAFKGIEGASLLIQLDMKNICASTGSACSASAKRPSHVLRAIGVAEEYINGSLRLSLSKYTTEDEINRTVEALKESVALLRSMCTY